MKTILLSVLVSVSLLLGGRTTSLAQIAAPTNVTATPSTINLGSSSNLNATATDEESSATGTGDQFVFPPMALPPWWEDLSITVVRVPPGSIPVQYS